MLKKNIPTNLKLPDTIFKYLKTIVTNLKILGTIFLLIFFSNFLKKILTNLKIRETIFKHLKKHTYESENS